MNEETSFSELRPTVKGFRNSGWRKALEKGQIRDFGDYARAFLSEASEARRNGDVDREHALKVLGAACSMYHDSNDSAEPLKPMIVTTVGCSPALSGFEDQHLKPLSEVLQEFDDLALRARLADLLWIRSRDHAAARTGAMAYLEMAKASMDPENWGEGLSSCSEPRKLARLLVKIPRSVRQ